MGKIERKYLAHYINITPNTESDTYHRLGKVLVETLKVPFIRSPP